MYGLLSVFYWRYAWAEQRSKTLSEMHRRRRQKSGKCFIICLFDTVCLSLLASQGRRRNMTLCGLAARQEVVRENEIWLIAVDEGLRRHSYIERWQSCVSIWRHLPQFQARPGPALPISVTSVKTAAVESFSGVRRRRRQRPLNTEQLAATVHFACPPAPRHFPAKPSSVIGPTGRRIRLLPTIYVASASMVW